MMMSFTLRAATANSMPAAMPPMLWYGGMRLPTLRRMNSSPGWVWVIRLGLMRESEQVTKRVSGVCSCWSSRSNSSRWVLKICCWNW